MPTASITATRHPGEVTAIEGKGTVANEIKGERAQCPCQAEGWIVESSDPLDVNCVWWIIAHEGGIRHTVTRFWTGTKFNLVLEKRGR